MGMGFFRRGLWLYICFTGGTVHWLSPCDEVRGWKMTFGLFNTTRYYE